MEWAHPSSHVRAFFFLCRFTASLCAGLFRPLVGGDLRVRRMGDRPTRGADSGCGRCRAAGRAVTFGLAHFGRQLRLFRLGRPGSGAPRATTRLDGESLSGGIRPALAASLRKAGFNVELTDAEILAKTQGIQGAPWLVLYFPEGRIGYSGGYAAARPGTPGTSNRAETLMAAVAQGETVKSLPSFGCATSQALRAQLDPVGLRYPATAATTANFTPTPNPPPL